jgi:hypothetical protein
MEVFVKQVGDKQTGDLLDGFIRQRGRPATGNAKSAAQRKRESRERLRQAEVGFLTVQLPLELIDGLREFVKFKDVSQDKVVERLLRQQLLRKR